MLSLASQRSELERSFTQPSGIEVVEFLEESRSAKQPGRPVFEAMLARIEHGEADGILSWHPDRLARNAIDGGRLIHLLDTGKLRDLKFATFTFENNSQGKFMLAIMFGYSKYYVDTLSENIRRGYRAKIALGWRPNAAPLGYLNDRTSRTIVPDPERFALVQKLFRLAQTGAYSLRALREETIGWGLRTPQHRRRGGAHLTISGIHRLLTNPFYAGLLPWKGQVTKGAHVALITLRDFDEVQRRLRRPGRSKAKRLAFPLTGIIRCGECGFMVTAEHKVNRQGHRYTYYHCTKRRLDYRCRQRSIRAEVLEGIVLENLQRLALSAPLLALISEAFRDAPASGEAERDKERKRLQRDGARVEQWRTTLRRLAVRGLISDDEMLVESQEITKERERVENDLRALGNEPDWFEFDGTLKSFRTQAIIRYSRGDSETKRRIMRAVCSNLILKDGELRIQANKPFVGIAERAPRSYLRRSVKEVRTLYQMKDPDLMATLQLVRSILAEPLPEDD